MKAEWPRRLRTVAVACAAAFFASVVLSACNGLDRQANYPTKTSHNRPVPNPTGDEDESIFGPEGLSLFGGSQPRSPGAPGIGVNTYLWRASLDTLAFMPLVSADPFGGVIITDWYASPQSPNERFKMTVYILDRQLRADGVKVAVFRQERRADGWTDATVNPETAAQLENAILTRARQLRIDTAGVG